MSHTDNQPGHLIRRRLEEGNRRGDIYAPDCPSRGVLDHVTTRWGVLVLVLLLKRPHRFSELAAAIAGISDKMLSQSLKQLCADGFVNRTVTTDPPVRVTYDLTDTGREVGLRLADLVDWIEANLGDILAARSS